MKNIEPDTDKAISGIVNGLLISLLFWLIVAPTLWIITN